MKKAKRLFIGLSSSVLLLSGISSVSANGLKNDEVIEIIPEEEVVYSYIYNGIEFTGNTELDEQALKNLYDLVIDEGISQRADEPGGGNGVKIHEPMYKSYKNNYEKEIANLFVAHIVTRIPIKITSSTLGNYIFNTLTGWATGKIEPQHVGSWVTRSWSDYYDLYLYHATLVHYTDSTFKTPKKVQYWEVNRSTDPNLET